MLFFSSPRTLKKKSSWTRLQRMMIQSFTNTVQKKKKELITIRQVFINPKSIETEKASYLIALVLKKKLYGKLQNT